MNTFIPTVVYPSLISRACAVLDESPVFKDMPDGHIRIVIRLVKKINLKRLTAPIVASRQKLAEESGKSVETVHRVIRWLEEKGLVERKQRARPGMCGSSSPLVPTKKLLDALLLSEEVRANVDSTVTANNQINDKIETNTSKTNSTSFLTKSNGDSTIKKSAFERIGTATIPKDLVWLIKEQGMKCSGVLQLMKLAGLAKQRLSTVVTATKKYLQGLHGRELYAYLRALLNKGKDFGIRAVEEEIKTTEESEREYLKQKGQALAGRSFQNRDKSLLVTVDESGRLLVEIRNGQRAARPFCREFVDAIESGRLRGVQEVCL